MKKLYLMASLVGIFASSNVGAVDASIDDTASCESQCVCESNGLGGFYGALGIGGNFSKSDLDTTHQYYKNKKFIEAVSTMYNNATDEGAPQEPSYADEADARLLAGALDEELFDCGFENMQISDPISSNSVDSNASWGVAEVKFESSKHERIANLGKNALMGVVAIGYGHIFSNNVYLGGECLLDFGKKNEKGLDKNYVNNSPDAANEWSSLEHGAVTPVISIRGGYYLDTIQAMPYLKIGVAFINIKAANKYSSVKLCKAVPEIALGLEKTLAKRASLRLEFGYRLNSKTHGKIDSDFFVSEQTVPGYDSDAISFDTTKTSDVNLEHKGFVVRLLTAIHI
jgi:opacity protein-like surface antigen